MIELSGWGRYPRHFTKVFKPRSPVEVARIQPALPLFVARGNGRAYGDAAIGVEATLDCRALDRMKQFDPATGRLTVEAGVLLSDIIACFLPRGFFPAVVPGTRHVTVGGMIASDVHGKNHHRVGGFGHTLDSITLILPSGERRTCSINENSDLFSATVGGMGLTGTIVEACIRLQPVETGWIRQRTIVAKDLNEALNAFVTHDQATYSVAWIDCLARGSNLGRSLVYVGEHVLQDDLAQRGSDLPLYPTAKRPLFSAPVDLPSFALNRYSVAAFNQLYFRRGAHRAAAEIVIPWDEYFFPLDNIERWNRIYGRRGFLEHQCVLPENTAHGVLGDILERVAARGEGSFLAVLKKLSAGIGLLSFPIPGYTLALDFAVSNGVFAFLDEIDRLVIGAGGRLYLAKDGRQSPTIFEAGYPELGKFREIRKAIGADRALQSCQSKRLLI
jgi:decaprenylphospho-beta-D-ribofuranose 2-oxidase